MLVTSLITFVQALGADIKALRSSLAGKVDSTDTRLTNAREWTATTVSQAEAETGTASTRRAWTAQRVRQAVNAWWQVVSSGFGRNLVQASNATAARNTLELGSAATQDVGTGNNNVMQVGAFGLGAGATTPASTDLNALHGQPTQFKYFSNAALNAPPGASYGAVINVGTTNGNTSQLAIGYRDGDGIHWRGGYQGFESHPWREIFHTGNFDPASKLNVSAAAAVATSGQFSDLNDIPSNALGSRTVSTQQPSGGADGDIWFVV